jgi:[protein-PII] uridylyltransferase
MLPSAVSFRARRSELIGRADLHGDDFCRALAGAADEWLTELLDEAAGGDLHRLVLVAFGGYGRGELCPYSDLDVVLVHERRDVGAIADAVWYPVWDEGIRLDHSVRRPGEVLDAATEDLRVQLGLLDGRVVAGDAALAAPLLAGAADLWRARAGRWLPVLAAQVDERHRAHGDVAFLLEPDLKEAHGGLRDVHAVIAATRALTALGEQVDTGLLEGPRATLTQARVELHRTTGRSTERLLLQEQDQVATALGDADADALMARVAEAGRTVAWVADDAWRRRTLWSAPSRRRRLRVRRSGAGAGEENGEGRTARVEPGVSVLHPTIDRAGDGVGAEVVLGVGAVPATDPTLALRVGAVSAERGLPVARSALEVLAAEAPPPSEPWPVELRDALVRVLQSGQPAIPALEALDQHGLLTRLLPEWAAVRNRPQRNAYHRFTVDRHLLEAAARAAPLALGVDRPDLLLVGALLHDIGKGYPGDHTEAGIELVGTIGRRMGFGPEDVQTLVALVRLHLLLPDAATRRDLDDPETVRAVADAVGDRQTLSLLAALTEADSLATGPAAWGPWKAGLVKDLVRRVDAVLSDASAAGIPAPSRTSAVTDRHRQLMAQAELLGRSIVTADPPGVTVVARDRPGLLATVTGVLALRGLDVRSANVAGEGDFAVETFVVEPSRGRWPDWDLVADEVDAALRGTLPLGERLAQQERVYAGGRRPAWARPPETRVVVDNSASAVSTVVDVRAADAVGLLHRITTSLFDLGLDVVAARVSTLGDEVVDAFYVRDKATGGKLADPDRIRGLERAVRETLVPVAG